MRVRAAVVLLYLVPLGLTAAFLASRGLDALAVGLLAAEACVVTAAVLARRERPAREAVPRDGSRVLLALGGGVLLVVVALVVLVRTTTP